MVEWKTYRLGEVITIKYGKDHKSLSDGPYPVYGSGGVMRHVEKAIFTEPSILIPRKGSLNNVLYVDTPFWTVDTMFWSIIKTDIVLPHFLYYLIRDIDFASLNVGSAVPSLTCPIIEAIEVQIPSIETQHKILNCLEPLDKKIALNNRINHNLEVQAQALFKSWFVDFEPFKEGKFVDSELGLIPEGWGVYRVGELPLYIADYVANGSFASLKENVKLYESENYAVFIRNTDLKSGSFPVYVDFHSYTFLSKTKLTGGEIIISNVGDVGSVHFCPELCKPMTLGNNVIMIKTEERQYYAFLYLCFKYFTGHHSIESITGGSAMPKFNKTDFKGIKLIIPSTKVLSRFDEIVSPMFKRIGRNKRENEKLSKQRDTLLPLLLSGQITC